MSALEGNLGVLRGRLPTLAELLEDLAADDPEASPPFDLVATPSGYPSARVSRAASSRGEVLAAGGFPASGGAWLHSSRDPSGEARRLAASVDPDSDAVVLLGFGLGYLAEALLDAGAACVLVCESDPAALLAALAARDLRLALSDLRLGFVLGGDPDLVISALEYSGASRACIRAIAAVEAQAPDWYGAARDAVGRWNSKGEINEATLRRFGRLWVRNLSANLERIASCPGVERLEGLAAGMPVLVLAAGPSLDLVLPKLAEIAQRAILVCVDTALRSLLRVGIEPDFLVVVDPQYWNWRHIAGLASPSSILVSESAAWPAIFRFRARKAYLSGSLFPLGRRIESFVGRKGTLGAGGSVATSAWDLARLMGAASIWMAGLDLGYPGGATHACASLFEQRALVVSRRLAPASGAQAAALLGAQAFEAPSASGGKVLTDKRMQLYAWWFESRLARASSPATLSLSHGGLAIPGMELGWIAQLLVLPPIRPQISERLATAASIEPPPRSREDAAAGFAALLSELGDIESTASKAAEAAARGRAKLTSEANCRSELAILDAADSRLLRNASRDVVGFLLPRASELVGRKAKNLSECLERSESIYRSVADSAAYQLRLLRR